MGGIRRSHALCASTGTGSSSGCSGAGDRAGFLGERPSPSPLIPLLFFQLVPLLPGTFANSHCYHFYLVALPHTVFYHTCTAFWCSFNCSYKLSHFLCSFSTLLIRFCAISTIIAPSHLFRVLALFKGKWKMLFWRDLGTPGNVKVIASDCQRLLEIVDNSTFKHVTILTKSYKKLILFGGFKTSAFFNDQGNFLGRRKYY